MKLLAPLLLVLFLLGCGGRSIIGVWEARYSSDDPKVNARMQEVMDPTDSMEFREDGTAIMKIGGLTVNGSFEKKGETVTFTATNEDGVTKSHDLTLSADGNSMSGVMKLVRVVLTRSAE